ncbi:hypothetical protein KKP04_13260 [Rhodomicrobium sp. Az07]|uniref:Clp protease N-terminal domain-containing protein n=1 Tax=Rhodomicrobium sp. Az07 TaxID=2839034 RepID=UPI001BEA39D7|nr:Clp protease N-terminal domain-containing protein [Rhodomicrobium sp. Az07]MBT3071835.1 hypothetical protein [Rhodomicrobium sp. Az07]
MNDHSAATVELPRTAYLDHTLRRARSAAEQRSHRYVTLEHLLFTLLDDPDASRLLSTVGADVAVIRATITDTVNNRMGSLAVPDGRAPNFSYKFDTLFISASQDAARAGRHEIDGALALLAVAREPESNASAILGANGFDPAAALHAIAASRSSLHAQTDLPPPPKAVSRPEERKQAPVAATPHNAPAVDDGMDDMLTSVRDFLEAEQRKEAAGTSSPAAPAKAAPHPPSLGPVLRAQVPPPPPQSGYALSPFRDAPPLEPGLGTGPELRMEPPQQSAHNDTEWTFRAPEGSHASGNHGGGIGFDEPEAPRFDLKHPTASGRPEPAPLSFDLERPVAPPPFDAAPPRLPPLSPEAARAPVDPRGDKKGKRRPRNADAATGLIAKILQPIPRRTRIAAPETVELLLSRDEAWALFARARPQGAPGAETEPHAPVRAVTVRLSAPEGGFFIEGQSPETQWLLDRPALLGEEHFGSWVWIVVPNEKGAYPLIVSLSARDIDTNGTAVDLHVPDQAVKVQVRGNFWRGFGSLLRTLLLLAVGGGFGAAAYYGLKLMGKVP